MITLKEISPNVFELTESLLGWSETKITFWYWDLEKKLCSEKPDFPDGLYTKPLTDDDLERFERYYRPLICRREIIK